MTVINTSFILFRNNLIVIRNELMSCRNLCTKVAKSFEIHPNQKEKLIRIAIIGPTNAGKSTLINKLLNHRICPISPKVHTTHKFAKAIGIKNNAQVILFDTPGLVTEAEAKKYKNTSGFASSCRYSIENSDLIGVVHDVSNKWTRNELNPTVLKTLQAYPKVPSFLILNKVDLLRSKHILLDLTKVLTQNTVAPKGIRSRVSKVKREEEKKDEKENKIVGWRHFSEVFMVSGLTGDGVEKIMKYLVSQSKEKCWEYGPNEFTDQPPEELIVQTVRARLLDNLPQEIPYTLKCEIEYYSLHKGHVFASVQVSCPSEKFERIVCGTDNERLRYITERATSDLVETFAKPISLTISAKYVEKQE